MRPLLFVISVLLISCNQNEDTRRNHVVEIKNMKFNPAEIEIDRQDTVTFVNLDILDHDVTEFTNRSWTSGVLKSGSRWSRVIDESMSYFCSIHVVMTGKIKVN
jgi:plastocyanin